MRVVPGPTEAGAPLKSSRCRQNHHRRCSGRRMSDGEKLPCQCPCHPAGPRGKAKDPASGRPPRRYSWEPFQPGNEVGKRHGSYGREVQPMADALAAELATEAPWTARPAFAAGVAAWGRAEARCLLVGQYLDREGMLDDEGKPRPAVALVVTLERAAANLRARLALDPVSLAKLLSTLVSTGNEHQMVEERERLLSEARELVETRPGA